jgi:hypothetical protein
MTTPYPHPGNLPPLPVDDPHKRIANHEDLLLTDLAEVEQNVLDSPDSFAAWTEEIKHLHELPPTEVKPEDERNHEALARIIDRPPTLLSCEAAEKADDADEPQMVELGGLLKSLGEKAEKSQRIYDIVGDRAEIEATTEYKLVYRQLKSPKMKLTDDEVYQIYADQILTPQQSESMALVDGDLTKLAALLQKYPDQWRYVRHATNVREDNVTDAHGHLVAKEGKTAAAEGTERVMATKRPLLVRDGENPDGTPKYRTDLTDIVPVGSLERATVVIDSRDARTSQEIAGHLHGFTQLAADNFRGFLRSLEARGVVPNEGGALLVADFQKHFESVNGSKIEDAVTALKEGVALKELLEAVTEDDRAKAEQPLWRDMVYTERALRELNEALTDMKDEGMSTAHSHYRALYEKAKEIELTHVQTWQRWQSLRVDRAAYAHPATPDFKGRIPAVMYLKDGDKGMYSIPPRGEGTTIVYPDSSTRSITVDSTGVATTHDRVNLDGSEWKPRPVELEYQDAAPITSTMTSMGRVSLGMYNSLAANEKRVDNRDIATLVGQLPEMEYDWRMRPGDPNAVQAYYRFNRLIDQRATESIAEIRGDGTTPLTDVQEQRIANLRVVRTQAEYRAHYLQHGSEGDDSTMNRDGAVTFQGALHNEQGNWTILPSGFAWKEEITRKPDGSREVGHVLYSPDGSVYGED